MSRWEFMRRLEELLFDISPGEREEALQYYNDYFNDAGMENEQEVIRALGSPEQVAKIVRDGLGDNSIQGEFTENGFSSGRAGASNELIKKETAGSDTDHAYGSQKGGSEGQHNTGAFKENSGDFRQKAGTFENSTGSFGQGMGDFGNGYAQNTESFEQTDKGQPSKEKKDMPVWAIVLIVIGCIFASPVLLGIACGILGVIVGLAAGVLGLVFGLGLAAVILFIVAVSLMIAGSGVIIPHPLMGIGLLGGGFICASLGILFMLLVVLLVTKLIPAVCQGIAYIYNSIFRKKGGAVA